MNQSTESGIQTRIKQRLEELGLSMKGASQEAGLGETAIRDLMRPGHSPRTSTIEALAPVLQTSVEWLMTGRGPEAQDPEVAEIVDIWSRIPDRDAKKALLDFARWQARKK